MTQRSSQSFDSPDATGGLIPYRNPMALSAYYVSIGSLVGLILPPLGVAAGLTAVVLGVLGWRKFREDPLCGGQFHSWIGIILGGVVTLIAGAVLTLLVLAMFFAE